MSVSSLSLSLQLGEQQLAKLTNDNSEIRMRAFDQIESRLLRALQQGETINFKPVYLVKQLIRWFGYTPPLAADRVLSLLLDLLRSDYADVIMRKMPLERLQTELEKVRKIVRCLESRSSSDILDELQDLLSQRYNSSRSRSSSGFTSRTPLSAMQSCADCPITDETTAASMTSDLSLLDGAMLSVEALDPQNDFEQPWSRATVDDLASLTMLMSSISANDQCKSELLLQLTQLRIRMSDYPIEHFLQAPYIFLQLLRLQHRKDERCWLTIKKVNRTLLTFVQLLRRRLLARRQTLNYAQSMELSGRSQAKGQIRVQSALRLLLSNCLHMLSPLVRDKTLKDDAIQQWHLFELAVETLRTFEVLQEPVAAAVLEMLRKLADDLLYACNTLKSDGRTDNESTSMSRMVARLTLPRLHSLLFNDLLLDGVALNIACDPSPADRQSYRLLLEPLIVDNTYLAGNPQRMRHICNLMSSSRSADEDGSLAAGEREQQLIRLKTAYSLALSQLQPESKSEPTLLLQMQRQVCLVLNQLGSERLVQELLDAIVKCTPLYTPQRASLRREAESLLNTLFELPDDRMILCVFRTLGRPVIAHFHALMNRTQYMSGCNNLELVRRHILGVPWNKQLLQKLVQLSWPRENSSRATTTPSKVQQCCLDCITMLLKVGNLVGKQDFQSFAQLFLPVLPLIIARSVGQEQLQPVVWQLLEPDTSFLTPPDMLRGNVCFMFVADAGLRQEATTRVAYTLRCEDYAGKFKPNMAKLSSDIFLKNFCVVEPPRPYDSIYSESSTPRAWEQQQLDLQSLLRLLSTPDLKPCIHKSTLVQLNVLLQDWRLAGTFNDYEMLLKALYMPLRADPSSNDGDIDTLQPTVGILMKLLINSADLRRQMHECFEVLVCLLRIFFLQPLAEQLCADVAICLFLLLYHEHVLTTEEQLLLNAPLLPALHVPLTHNLDESTPPSPATEGLALERRLVDTHFFGRAASAAQHWRLFIAHRISKPAGEICLGALQKLDITDYLRLQPIELALVKATCVNRQLEQQLVMACNSSNHTTLEQLAALFQIFVVQLGCSVAPEQAQQMWKLLHKYLRLTPKNLADRQLHRVLMELCLSCLRHGWTPVLEGLNEALETDPHHSFLVMLMDRAEPLHVYQLLGECFEQLLKVQREEDQRVFSWHGQLFTELSAALRTLFDLRQLQHARCVLGVLRCLSQHPLQLSDTSMRHYIQHFVRLSSELRASTQTGAQWQRGCLYIICQLQLQCSAPSANSNSGQESCATSNYKFLRYLLGLCGHSDGEVRGLAWVCMANCITRIAVGQIEELLPQLDFLPGGLPACCLTTLLDVFETMLVRQLAGRVLLLLMPALGGEAAIELLERHAFMREALASFSALQMDMQLPRSFPLKGPLHSCEILSCYVAICARVVVLQPSWCGKLMEHAFIIGLPDLLKVTPPPRARRAAYYQLCNHICELYALCYGQQEHFAYLQRSICRDPIFLRTFVTLLEEPQLTDGQLLSLLKLLLVFCKDTNAYGCLCEQFKERPKVLLQLLLKGLRLKQLGTALQRYTLSALTLLLVRSQHMEEQLNLVRLLEAHAPITENAVEVREDVMQQLDSYSDKENSHVNDLSNRLDELNLGKRQKHKQQEAKEEPPLTDRNAAILLYLQLDRLFDQLYPTKSYNFRHPPDVTHVQVCEALGVLLKLSPCAQKASRPLRLLERVLQLLDHFLNDPNVGNASVYMRRVGAHKAKDILSNLIVLLNMLLHWHSSHHALISEPAMATGCMHLLLRIWPWLSHSAHLKQLCLRLCVFLTEHSFEMCKQASLIPSNHSQSLLQLMVRVADHETTKKEAPSTTTNGAYLVEAVLRVMKNCCACSEGRLSLVKLHVLDIFDIIFPGSGNSSAALKVRPELLLAWLSFWEVYSRYDVGAKACHVHALLNGVRRSPPLSEKRMLCLRILRNMCFYTGNRTQLVAMDEYINLMRDIVAQPVRDMEIRIAGGSDEEASMINSYEEHHLVTLCLWKLFGFGAKYKAMLRSTKLAKQLARLKEQLDFLETQRPENFRKLSHAKELSKIITNLFASIKE
ncbi:uncharacterized protein LOC115629744 [Scaptodrosophila lebanonensis]|uniref:Uncharacterized protein LOC115629744 n=1 Tax=Drosophila lebanonensis TaxID=7225 RepID=A0A6J2U3U1_DROLE|nr:uncharacterized protein LOC115629744 [Scaptodrosophila lebanonensis]